MYSNHVLINTNFDIGTTSLLSFRFNILFASQLSDITSFRRFSTSVKANKNIKRQNPPYLNWAMFETCFQTMTPGTYSNHPLVCGSLPLLRTLSAMKSPPHSYELMSVY